MKHCKKITVEKGDAWGDLLNDIFRAFNDFTFAKKNSTG